MKSCPFPAPHYHTFSCMSLSFPAAKVSHKLNVHYCTYKWGWMHGLIYWARPSKILEWIIHNRLLDHLLSNNFLSNRQFGFRPGSLTQEALLCATNDWSHCLDRGTSVVAVSLDLSKAFDRVPPANSSLPLLTLVFLALSLRGSVATSPAALSEWLLMAVRLRCAQSLLECCKAPSLALFCSRSIWTQSQKPSFIKVPP